MLDDARDVAGAVAHDAAVAGRVLHPHAQQGKRLAVRGRRHQALQRGGLRQRHVAVQHQHQVVVGHGRHRLLQRVPGAQLLGLQRPVQGLARERLAHLLAAVAVDHVDVGRRGDFPRGVDHVLQQGAPGEGLQHLGQVGLHALALAGGQDDDGHGHLRFLRGGHAPFYRSHPAGPRLTALRHDHGHARAYSPARGIEPQHGADLQPAGR